MATLSLEYSAVAKAEKSTAGRAMFTATDFSWPTPSRVSRFLARQSMPSPSVKNTGSAVSSTRINISIQEPPVRT